MTTQIDNQSVATSTFACPECARRERMDARDRAEGRRVYTHRPCSYCMGSGTVTVDPQAIANAVTVSRGKAKGTLRRSRPALADEKGGVYGAAWVWRMIRFDSGQDMHMPVMASEYIGISWVKQAEEDDLVKALEALSQSIGESLFGKVAMMRGAASWGRVLGMEGAEEVANKVEELVGLPMGNGYALGDFTDSPEAAFDAVVSDFTDSPEVPLDALDLA